MYLSPHVTIYGRSFHIINYSSFDLFQHVVVKDVKTIRSSKLVRRVGGQVWPVCMGKFGNPQAFLRMDFKLVIALYIRTSHIVHLRKF